MTSSNQSASMERGALKIFGVLFIVLGVVYLISGGMISVVLSQLLGSSVNWLGWIVFAVTVAAALYATKIRKDARNA